MKYIGMILPDEHILKAVRNIFSSCVVCYFLFTIEEYIEYSTNCKFLSQSKYSSRVKFLFGEYRCRANVAASLALMFAISNSVSTKSK